MTIGVRSGRRVCARSWRLGWPVLLICVIAGVLGGCGNADPNRSSSAPGASTVVRPAGPVEAGLNAEVRRDAWDAALGCPWARSLALRTADRVKFTPISDTTSTIGVMVAFFYPQEIVIPVGTPMLEPAGERASGSGSRAITPSTRAYTVRAVMVAVVGGGCTYATPVPEPIAAYERNGSESVDEYR